MHKIGNKPANVFSGHESDFFFLGNFRATRYGRVLKTQRKKIRVKHWGGAHFLDLTTFSEKISSFLPPYARAPIIFLGKKGARLLLTKKKKNF